MAWVDDRIWCHPKFTDLSAAAGWTWTKGCAYSSGFGTKGFLSREQQRLVGGAGGARRELVEAGLWEERPGGSVYIHDWHEHNSKRDARREADRDRKRKQRAASAGQSTGQSAGVSAGTARVDGSEGSDGSEGTSDVDLTALPSLDVPGGLEERLWRKLVVSAGAKSQASVDKLVRTVRANRCTERDVVCAIEAAVGPGVRDPLAVALVELKRRAGDRKKVVA